MKIPFHPDAVTAAWLTETLRATGVLQNGSVTSLTTASLGNEKGLTGNLVRLRLDYDTTVPEAPRSLVAKFSTSDPEKRAVIHAMGFYQREVGFYGQLAAHSPLRSPRCYFSAIDTAEGLSVLLLEDLAPARNGSWVAGCSVEEAELVVRAIAPFHAGWWCSPRIADMNWLQLRGLSGVHEAQAVFQHAWEPFLGKRGVEATREVVQLGEWLAMHLMRLGVYLYGEAPYTLIHNDYQADNLYFTGAGPTLSLAVADWQLVTRGSALCDVATFLGGNLDPADRRAHERRLLGMYHSLLCENSVRDYSFDQCLHDYHLALLYPIARIATVVGIGAVPSHQERGFCDVLFPRYCEAVHDVYAGDTSRLAEVFG